MVDSTTEPTSTESVEPRAPQRAHTWRRPTGEVSDPWAWLRDGDDPETIAYLNDENAHFNRWMNDHRETVDAVYDEIKARTQETDDSVPVRVRSWWYQSGTVEGSSYSVHRRGTSRQSASEIVVLDENVEAEGQDYFELGSFDISPNERLLAWTADVDGAERYTLRVRDLHDGGDLEDVLEQTSGQAAWANDNRHLFYVCGDEQNRPYQVWRHRLGTPQTEDEVVYEDNDERYFVSLSRSRSNQWLIIESHSKVTGECHLLSADDPTGQFAVIRPRVENVDYSVDHWGDRFVVLTDLDAEDFRVMTAPENAPDQWSELIAHEPGRRIVSIDAFRDHLIIQEWADAQPRLRILFRDGTQRIVDAGTEPHNIALDQNPEWDTDTVRYSFTSFTVPQSIYEESTRGGDRALLKQTPVPNADLSRYVASREWATAEDGTLVPVDIVRRADLDDDGSNPCIIYAYGSYEMPISPWFSVARLSLLDRGIVWALAHPRGGGELGRRWYLDGKLLNKRNTFTDTIACAEHLAQRGWADAEKIAVRGGSAGGLLVGACVTMRPDLFAAGLAEVPFVDVVTSMSDTTLPLTVTEWEEWGDPRSEPAASYMESYSPYDNTLPADYPALYVTAGLNDPRVPFHEPAKWVARLRSVRTNSAPLIFRCEMSSGHGGASGRYEQWLDEARAIAFVVATIGD